MGEAGRNRRSPADAAGESLAGAALAAAVDDRGYPRRRRMALVRHGAGSGADGRIRAIPGAGGGHGRRGSWYRTISQAQTRLRAETAVRAGAALLGDAAAAGPVFLPVGTHDHGVRSDGRAGDVLPDDVSGVVLLRRQR